MEIVHVDSLERTDFRRAVENDIEFSVHQHVQVPDSVIHERLAFGIDDHSVGAGRSHDGGQCIGHVSSLENRVGIIRVRDAGILYRMGHRPGHAAFAYHDDMVTGNLLFPYPIQKIGVLHLLRSRSLYHVLVVCH